MCRRRLKIKKLIFSAALIISTLLLTCTLFEPDDELYSGGGSRNADNSYLYTVYLDGYTPPSSSRALSRENAMRDSDLFEIGFYRNDGTNTTVARGAWERGHTAGVSGVARNVDYRYVSVAAAGTNSEGATNPGAAILFVGKRSDKTLLGVGRLVGVNNGTGDIASTTVTDETVSVTFRVYALKAGASRSANKNASTFFTGTSTGTTQLVEVYIGSRIFPLYNINRNQTTTGSYRLDIAPPSDPVEAATYNFAYFNAGILRGGAATLIQNDAVLYPAYGNTYRLQPRYPWGNGTHGLPSSTLPPDTTTTITITNNQGGTALQNPVGFTFVTGAANGVVFAFAFEMPVYPLTNVDNRGNNNFWYIRPGSNSYIRDLDDGMGGTGGAILIGVGDIDQSLTFSFFVGSPFKTRYYNTNIDTSDDAPPITPGNPEPLPALTDYVFNLNGLDLAIRAGGVPIKGIPVNAAQYFFEEQQPPATGRIAVTPNTNLFNTIFLTNGALPMGAPIYDAGGRIQYNPAFLPYIQNDMIKVRVEYFDPDTQAAGDDPYYGFFYVYLSNPGSLGPIPPIDEIDPSNRLVIMNWLDMTIAANTIMTEGSGKFILLLYDSMDFPVINLTGGPYLFIILAAAPNLTFGKIANGGFTNWTTGNTYYFGIWPYDEDELIVFGQAVSSYPFRLNAAGSYTNIDSGVRQYPLQWFMRNPNYAPPDSIALIVNTGAVDVVWPDNFLQVNTVNPP
jgi:hypothetical protein